MTRNAKPTNHVAVFLQATAPAQPKPAADTAGGLAEIEGRIRRLHELHANLTVEAARVPTLSLNAAERAAYRTALGVVLNGMEAARKALEGAVARQTKQR